METNDPRIFHQDNEMSVDASVLGWWPGHWPDTFETADKHVFVKGDIQKESEEFVGYTYKDAVTNGVLLIFND